MSKFKRIISLLLAIVSFCVLELANPLQTLAEELNRLPTAEAAVLQEIEEPNSLPSMELQEPSLVAVPSSPDEPQAELYILVYIFVTLSDAKGSAPTYAGTVSAYTYQYDANGNITQISQGSTIVTYSYDAANQLIRENNGFTNQTVTYEYDSWGNILNKKTYAYTTGDLTAIAPTTDTYTYGNESWGDQLTAYNGQSIVYDEMGNPTTYLGYTMGWQGKQLISVNNGTNSITYTYNEDGLRLTKTVNGTATSYYYNGSVLISMATGSTTQQFHYDASGSVIAVTYNGTEYYYLRNAQGDIVKLIDSTGATVVEYTYDSWGKLLSTTGSLATTLGSDQPFRYRGYVYDTETSRYYLQTRYYDPSTCRFISSDVVLSTGQGVLGHNAYAYCGNNPANCTDYTGKAWYHWAIGAAIVAACAVATVVTCGGFAAAATAVCMVGSGVAAATTASTIAAGAFIGTATAFGVATLSVASTSNSAQDFLEQGNAGIVATTVFGGFLGGCNGYGLHKAQVTIDGSISRGSTGRTEPNNLQEQLAMEQVKSNPSAGYQLPRLTMTDSRWPASEGWIKMQQIVPTSIGNINIHYVHNTILGIFDDFKFK